MTRIRPSREMLLLVAVAAVLNFAGIMWGLPNADNDWAIDSIAPIGPLSYAQRMLYGQHWWSKYPPLHFTLLSLIYAPYVAFLKMTGSLESGVAQYPYGFARPEISLPLFTLMARTVSAGMGIATAVAAAAIAREFAGRRAGFVAGLLFAASPLAVYYAHTANLDMPYMFWSSLALLCLVRIAQGATVRAYVGLGVFAAAAVATKDQAYGLFLLLPVPLLAMHAARGGRRGLLDPRLAAGLGAAIVAYAVAANVLLDFSGWLAHLRFITGEGSRPYEMFPATPSGYVALARHTPRLVAAALTVPAVALGLGGLAWAISRRLPGAGLLAFAVVAYLVVFLGPIRYALPRFVLPVVFVLAVFAGVAAVRLWETRRRAARVATVAVVVWAVAHGASMNLGFLWDSRYAAEAWLARNLPAGARVGYNGERAYLPRLPLKVEAVPVEITPEGLVAAGELPDYLVLSEAYYRRYLREEPLRLVTERLLEGKDRDYERAASVERLHLPALRLIPGLSPRIVILRRKSSPAGDRGQAPGPPPRASGEPT